MSKLRLSPVGQPNRLISYWKREWPVVIAIAVLGVAFNGSMSLGPVLQGNLLDTIISGAALQDVLRQCALFVSAILAIQLLRFGKRYYVRLFANRTGAAMRMMIYNNMLSRTLPELERENAGDLMNKAIADVGICVEGMRKVTTEVFDTGVLMLGYVITLSVYDLRLTLLSCLFVPVAMLIAERLKKAITGYSQAYRKQSSRVAGLTLQNIEAVALMRVNGMEQRSFDHYQTEVTDLSEKAVRANILENSMQPIYNAIAMLGMGFILYMGGQSVITGSWTVGMLSTYITIFTALAVKASKAAKLFNSAQKARVSWLRIKPYLFQYQTKDTADLTDIGAAELNVDALTFSYPGGEKTVLKQVSFKAEAGDIIGVTGPVACGKSTLGIALQGLYPYQGHIRLNGRELSDYTPFQKSQRISYLGHNAQLLSDTVYRNITLGDGGDISAVLRDVCFEEDLKAMPDGLNTQVGGSGARLSGGQQARLALARALYRGSPLIILDDPFSAVDLDTEQAILANLRQNHRQSIILLISHRVACFDTLDSVLLLGGHETLYGSHLELLAQSPFYASVYAAQKGEQSSHES